jgi:hypothetical protein
MAIGKQFIDLFFRVETKKAQKDIEDVGEGLDNVGKKGVLASVGLNTLGKGFKFIGGAIKAAGIGLLVGLLAQLTGIFQSNQKTADTFGRIMLKLQPVFQVIGDVIGFVAGLLEDLIDLFTGAINWIGGLIGVTNDVASATEGYAEDIVRLRNEVKIMNAELALTQLQYQKEAELQRQIRDDTSKTIDERIAANNRLGRILEQQSKEEQEMALIALELAEKELALDKENSDLQVKVIDAKTKLAEIDERITSQRSEQLTNLNSLEQERIDIETEATEKREARLKELIELQNKDLEVKKDIRTSITDQLNTAKDAHGQIMQMYRQELAMEIKLLQQEEERRLKAMKDAEQARKAAGEMASALGGVNIYSILDDNEEFKQHKAGIAESIVEESNQKILDLEKEYNQLMGEASQEYYQTEEQLILQAAQKLDEHFETEREKELREAEEKYATLFGFAENDAERTILLEQEKTQKLKEINDKYNEEAEASTAEFMNKIMDFNKKLVEAEIELDKKKTEAQKQNMEAANKTMQMGMALAGEGTAAYKVLASAETIMSTYTGASKALATTPAPFSFIQAGLIIATGMKNLAEIQKTKVPGGGGGQSMTDTTTGGGDVSGDVPAPTFGAIETDAPPVQAFVVESDVSGAQALQSELDLQSTL